ncbi:MAG: GNAT family N-acetyltransferase [Clostridia bacterium]|nr:GNAT family N-acetyltransferase [Clostridia bacterium]
MSEVIFRPFKKEDKPGVESFFADMGEKSASFFNVGHGNERRTMEFFENGKPDHLFYGLFDNERLLAYAFIWDTDKTAVWFGIAVRDGYQGRGLGGRLTGLVLEECRKAGHSAVLLRTRSDNVSARKLYEKQGFEQLGTHPSGEILYIRRFSLNERSD